LSHPGPKSDHYPHGKIAPELEQKLWEIAGEFTGKSYERNPLEMIYASAAMDAVFWDSLFGAACCACCIGKKQGAAEGDEDDLNSVFCSELVAHAYIETRVIATEDKAYMFLPKDFSTDPHNRLQDVMSQSKHELCDEVMILRDLSKHYEFNPDGSYESEDQQAEERAKRDQKVSQFERPEGAEEIQYRATT